MHAPRPGLRYEDKLLIPFKLKFSTLQHEAIYRMCQRLNIPMAQLVREAAMKMIEEAKRET